MKRRIVPGGILALSLAVALSAATASSASWAPGSVSVALGTWDCPPPSTPPTTFDQVPPDCLGSPAQASVNFGYRVVGSSTSRRFWLGVRGDTFSPRIAFNPTIGVSGEYAQTNSCPPTLSAGPGQIDGCLITVSFTPTGERTGPRPGTLTTGPGGPTMALTGNGEPRDSVPPDLKLSGDKTQNPQEDGFCDGSHCDVIVKMSCGDEACTTRTKGKLTNLKNDRLSSDGPIVIAPGKTIKGTGPEMAKGAQRRQVRRALDEGKNVKAKVTVRATDTSGNVATAKRTIKLVK